MRIVFAWLAFSFFTLSVPVFNPDLSIGDVSYFVATSVFSFITAMLYVAVWLRKRKAKKFDLIP